MARDAEQLTQDIKSNLDNLHAQPEGTHLAGRVTVYRKHGYSWMNIRNPGADTSPITLAQHMAFYPGEWALM